ncbi:MAG: hypothetical protein QM764_22150 [Chitinophagaceae bacterium]
MIKIENPDLANIAEEYFTRIKDHCKKRADFFLTVLNVLFAGAPAADMINFKLHGGTKKSLCNLLLRVKLGKNPNYRNVIAGNCHQWVRNKQAILDRIAVHLADDNNLRDLILVRPEDSYRKDRDLKIHFITTTRRHITDIYSFINKIIDYSIFDNHAYWLGTKLNINTCPYCNRSYIHTVIDKNRKEIIRPTFDHFFPQSRHPFLSLSFYNLIPSCYYCNSSLKTATIITPDTHLHPYLDGFGDDARFKILIAANKPQRSDPENYSIWLQEFITDLSPKYRQVFGKNANEGNVNLFQLNEIFLSHRDVVGELVVKCDKYSGGYADSLHRIFGHLNTNKGEFYQFYFGNYFNEKDFHRRPLAKMTKDIIRQVLPAFVK